MSPPGAVREAVASLIECVSLKAVARAGWARRGLGADAGPVESVAAHSWGVAWLVVAIGPPDLDRARALTYATLHDLAEVRVGDLTPHDGVAPHDKARREDAAFGAMVAGLPDGDALHAAWRAYEAQADAEARFVRQLDRLDMALQAVAYAEATGRDLRGFLSSAGAVIEDPWLRALLDELWRRHRVAVDAGSG